MKKLLFTLLFVAIFLPASIFATTETFQLTTDASGNVTAADTISFGKLTLQNFSSSHAFANVNVKVDGTSRFNAGVAAGPVYTVNADARSTFELVGTGGPANTTVTITINYIFSPVGLDAERTVEEGDRTTETFQLTTDGSGNTTGSENISFGKLTLQNFSCSHAFANAQIKIDGNVRFNAPCTANVQYGVNATATSKFELIATGGPANTTVTVTINYTFSPFRITEDSRDTDTFELTTNAAGNVTASEKISFGTLKLQTFKCDKAFGNVKVKTDGVVRFDKGVSANGKETVNASAKKLFELIAIQGPPSTKVVVTIEYTFSPVLLFNNIRDYCEWKASGRTDKNGDVHIREKVFDACHKVTLWGFNTNMKFNRIMLTVDNTNITPEPVEGSEGKMYLLNIKLEAGKHNISILAEGGLPNQEAVFNFLHKE